MKKQNLLNKNISSITRCRTRSSLKPALFLHIQKTAGTSIVDLARHFYGNANVVSHGDYLKWLDPIAVQPSCKNIDSRLEVFHEFPFISGHFGFDFARQFMRDRYTFTFLRDPIERILSYYYFCRNRDPNEYKVYALAQTITLEEFLLLGFTDPTIKACIWNNQSWQLAHGYANKNGRNILNFTPNEILDLSLYHLDDFSCIGFAESFDKDCNRILKDLGIDLLKNKKKSNTNPGRPTAYDLSGSTLEILDQLTKIDQVLYKEARLKHDKT